jgi:dihydropteroate synthase
LDLPIVIGASRKSFLGGDVHQREAATAAAHAIAVVNGAHMVRVHDVHAQLGAIRVADGVRA